MICRRISVRPERRAGVQAFPFRGSYLLRASAVESLAVAAHPLQPREFTLVHLRTPTRAYTFLEVALALAIIVVVFITVVPVISAGARERRMQDTMQSLREFVRDQRMEAEKTGREQMLIIQPGGLAVREGEDLVSKVQTPRGTKLSVRYPQGQWAPADGQEWRIFSCGLVAPTSLRLQEGSAWIESDFDFLTGSVIGERYSF